MYVGRFELQRKNYIGAITRFNTVAEVYAGGRYAPEAYFRIFEVYTIIGFPEEANKAYNILVADYPDSKWVKHANRIEKRFKKDLAKSNEKKK